MMYLFGLLVGDGTKHLGKNGRYMVWIDQHTRNIKILEKAKTLLENQGFNVFSYRVPGNKERILVYSKKLFQQFSDIMNDPTSFFESLSDEEKKEFISGLLDAEGTVTDRVVIYNSNRKLLESIKSFLTKLRIVCYIYRFGKIFGLQIYRKKSVNILRTILQDSIKLSPLSG